MVIVFFLLFLTLISRFEQDFGHFLEVAERLAFKVVITISLFSTSPASSLTPSSVIAFLIFGHSFLCISVIYFAPNSYLFERQTLVFCLSHTQPQPNPSNKPQHFHKPKLTIENCSQKEEAEETTERHFHKACRRLLLRLSCWICFFSPSSSFRCRRCRRTISRFSLSFNCQTQRTRAPPCSHRLIFHIERTHSRVALQ